MDQNYSQVYLYFGKTLDYIIPMPPMSGALGAADLGSGTSTTSAPMVMLVPAIDTAFCNASRVTRVGSTMRAALRSTNLLGY